MADAIRRAIEAGEWRPGDQLPSEPALCRRYGVSLTVVRGALEALRADGVVRTEHGMGSFVCDVVWGGALPWAYEARWAATPSGPRRTVTIKLADRPVLVVAQDNPQLTDQQAVDLTLDTLGRRLRALLTHPPVEYNTTA